MPIYKAGLFSKPIVVKIRNSSVPLLESCYVPQNTTNKNPLQCILKPSLLVSLLRENANSSVRSPKAVSSGAQVTYEAQSWPLI